MFWFVTHEKENVVEKFLIYHMKVKRRVAQNIKKTKWACAYLLGSSELNQIDSTFFFCLWCQTLKPNAHLRKDIWSWRIPLPSVFSKEILEELWQHWNSSLKSSWLWLILWPISFYKDANFQVQLEIDVWQRKKCLDISSQTGFEFWLMR